MELEIRQDLLADDAGVQAGPNASASVLEEAVLALVSRLIGFSRRRTSARWAECYACQSQHIRREPSPMQIRVGYELVYQCPQPTPMIVTLSIHYSRVSDIIKPDHLLLSPSVPVTAYRDSFGNWCSRIVAPAGQLRLSSDAVVSDSGTPDLVAPWLEQRPVEALPEETLLFLLGSRYCETDLLSETAWELVRHGADRLEARPGHLRLRASPHPVRLRPLEPDQDRLSGVPGSQGRVPRLRASRRHASAAA